MLALEAFIFALIFSVVTEPGRSMGDPVALSHI